MSQDRVAYWQDQIRANLAPEYQNINFVIDYPTLSLLEKYGLNALNLELRSTTVKSGVTLNYSVRLHIKWHRFSAALRESMLTFC